MKRKAEKSALKEITLTADECVRYKRALNSDYGAQMNLLRMLQRLVAESQVENEKTWDEIAKRAGFQCMDEATALHKNIVVDWVNAKLTVHDKPKPPRLLPS